MRGGREAPASVVEGVEVVHMTLRLAILHHFCRVVGTEAIGWQIIERESKLRIREQRGIARWIPSGIAEFERCRIQSSRSLGGFNYVLVYRVFCGICI